MAELVDALDSGSSRGFLGGCSSHLGRIIAPHCKVILIANGEMPPKTELFKDLSKNLPLIAIDGGVLTCEKLGVTPHALLGDFDSTPKATLKKYPHFSTPNQYKSDLEKATAALFDAGVKEAIVYGALGKRLDHTLYNLHLFTTSKIKLTFKTAHETMWLLPKKAALTLPPQTSFSLVPLGGAVKGVTTTGLKWNLNNHTLTPPALSLSNIALRDKQRISYTTNYLAISENRFA